MEEVVVAKEKFPESLREFIGQYALKTMHEPDKVGNACISFVRQYVDTFGEDYEGAQSSLEEMVGIVKRTHPDSNLRPFIIDIKAKDFFEDPQNVSTFMEHLWYLYENIESTDKKPVWQPERFNTNLQNSRTLFEWFSDKLGILFDVCKLKPGINDRRLKRLNAFLYEDFNWSHHNVDNNHLPSTEWFNDWVRSYATIANGHTRIYFMERTWYHRDKLDEQAITHLGRNINFMSKKNWLLGKLATRMGIEMFAGDPDGLPTIQALEKGTDFAAVDWRFAGSFLQACHYQLLHPKGEIPRAFETLEPEGIIDNYDGYFALTEKHGGNTRWRTGKYIESIYEYMNLYDPPRKN